LVGHDGLFQEEPDEVFCQENENHLDQKERKPTMKKIFKDIVEELEYEAVNKTLKMKVIGIALLERKMNNIENITIIKKEMIKRGYNIV